MKNSQHDFVMLNSQFNNLCLMSSFVSSEQGISVGKKYDRKSLHPMLLKCYHHLHLVTSCEIGSTNQKVDENCKLDILKLISNKSEQIKEFINRKL
jgi:hypothetical protein